MDRFLSERAAMLVVDQGAVLPPAKCSILLIHRARSGFQPHSSRLISTLFFVLIFCFSGYADVHAQKSVRRTARQSIGTLKVHVPSGVIGDRYWIYVNGRLQSSPPHGTPPQRLNVVTLRDGSGHWEGWSADGRVVTSIQIDEYLRSGDPYGIFHAVEFQVPAGSYSVEVLVPDPGNQSFPFLGTLKSGLIVRPGRVTVVYTSVPAGFSEMPNRFAPLREVGDSLCPSSGQFDISGSTDFLLKWGLDYRNNPMRQALLKAVASYRPGSNIITIDPGSGPREVDGQQVELVIQRFHESPFSLGDIEYCRKRLPQYSGAFSEFKATVEGINREMEALKKLAVDLSSAKGRRSQDP